MYLALKRRTTQGPFFKNNNLTSFHPLLLKKASCFPRLPLLPLFLPPPSLTRFPLCHVLVFICWFCSSSFSPCVKNERLKIGWVRWKGEAGGWEAWGKSSNCTSGEITVCSAETTLFLAPAATESTTQPHIHIHHTQKLFHRQCKTSLFRPVLNYCVPMWFSRSMTRGAALISHRQLHKKHPLNHIRTYKRFEKLNRGPMHVFLN